MQIDETGRVVGFVEKPQTEETLAPLWTSPEWMKRFGIHAAGRPYLASMGIYLFNRDVLLDLLLAPPPATDFGKEIFPRSIKTHKVQAYLGRVGMLWLCMIMAGTLINDLLRLAGR